MADSFADLWNSTAPSKPAEPPRKLGAISPTAPPARQPQNDLFSMLASPGSSNSNSRSITPGTGSIQATRSLGVGSPALAPANSVQKSTSSGGDAFSGLLSGTFSAANNSNGDGMTIAERAAKAERERIERLQGKPTLGRQGADTAWAGLDSLGISSFGGASSFTSKQTQPVDDEWDFASSPAQPKSHASKPADEDWGLDDFISAPATVKAPSSSRQADSLLDLDEFTSSAPSSRPAQQPRSRTDSPADDFDFGNREDGLLNNASDDEEDILGELGKPVSTRPARSARPTPSPQSRQAASAQRSRAPSPPAHIVGQIVEMGFSPEQARVSLAATDTGLDVQAALETLLASTESHAPPPPRERQSEGQRRPRERYADSDDERDPAPPRGPPQRARDVPAREGLSPGATQTQRNLQEQADKLLVQASELGLSMFSRANAFWAQGREKVQRAYEERAVPRAPADKGRPKWMQDAPEHSRAEGAAAPEGAPGGFSDEPEVLPPGPSRQGRAQQAKQPSRNVPCATPAAASSVKTGDLLSDDSPTVYHSPFRRKTPAQTPAAPAAAPAPARAPSPLPLVQRKTVSASSAAIATSAKHKASGTEMFKLGRYAEAESAYSVAISALPNGHLLLVPLYNNRALARLKTGEHSGAVTDCSAVLQLIGPEYHPAREAKVTRADEGAGVDLADAQVKALRRRAEAYESSEKWELARQDWEMLAGKEWAGKARGDAVRGAGRCRRMLNADADAGTTSAVQARPAAPPKPRPRPAQRGPSPPSVALDKVRAANEAAEAEDQKKHELKDVVDARLTAWKGGKETNIRALIASLDTVLWPELGWQKVGMHELVTPAQVKIRYTKAIAKLHPDKLHVNNTTLEQRMIANGVFGSLNDAWNAFKQ